jgi:hypothetical protein
MKKIIYCLIVVALQICINNILNAQVYDGVPSCVTYDRYKVCFTNVQLSASTITYPQTSTLNVRFNQEVSNPWTLVESIVSSFYVHVYRTTPFSEYLPDNPVPYGVLWVDNTSNGRFSPDVNKNISLGILPPGNYTVFASVPYPAQLAPYSYGQLGWKSNAVNLVVNPAPTPPASIETRIVGSSSGGCGLNYTIAWDPVPNAVSYVITAVYISDGITRTYTTSSTEHPISVLNQNGPLTDVYVLPIYSDGSHGNYTIPQNPLQLNGGYCGN